MNSLLSFPPKIVGRFNKPHFRVVRDVLLENIGIFTIDRITTHGRFRAPTIRTAREVFPEPLEPAIPII